MICAGASLGCEVNACVEVIALGSFTDTGVSSILYPRHWPGELGHDAQTQAHIY